MSPDDESDEEGHSLSGDETEPLPLTPEPDLSPYPDPERRTEASKKRKYTHSHFTCDIVHVTLQYSKAKKLL